MLDIMYVATYIHTCKSVFTKTYVHTNIQLIMNLQSTTKDLHQHTYINYINN